MSKVLYTSEAVTEGHPDKICDIIADKILDAALSEDKNSKVAIEVSIKNDIVFIFGEITTKAIIDYKALALDILLRLGYSPEMKIYTLITTQSKEIKNAVVKSDEHYGAGDQGIMVGFACNETSNYMPAPIYFANLLAERLYQVTNNYDFLLYDGKTQVTVEYDNNMNVKHIEAIVVSIQHTEKMEIRELEKIIKTEVIEPIIDSRLIDNDTQILVNPSGSFILGGSFGDAGTTGRKLVCDSYGSASKIGGGSYSGKDPTKVDRSGAYFARFIAKNIVANKLADRCEVQLAYIIGKEHPISIHIETFGTNKVPNAEIINIVNKKFDFRVYQIIKQLNLLQPIYYRTSCYGHFGKNELPWERIIHLEKF